MRRVTSRRGQPSSANGNAAAQVAKEQGLPQGWLAERRSGGHYVVYSPSGERFTSINAARQAARAQAEGGTSLSSSHTASAAGSSSEYALKREAPREKAGDYAECAASLPSVGAAIENFDLCEAVYSPFQESGNVLELVDAALARRKRSFLGCWRRGERLEAVYSCLFACSFDPERTVASLRAAARKRRAAERAWTDAESIEAARLVDSLSKDLGAVAARLRRPLGEVLAWYYREYKAFWSRKKARWPAKTGYDSTKRKRRNAVDYTDEQHSRSRAPAPADASHLRVDVEPPSPRSAGGRYLICASPRGLLAKRLTPRGWAPTPRSSAAHLVLDDLDDDDDDDEDEASVDEVRCEEHRPKLGPVERVAKTRQLRDTEAFDFQHFLKIGAKRRQQQHHQGDEENDEGMPKRPARTDEAVRRLSGNTFQGLSGGIWYVTKSSDTIRSVASERSLCPRQLRFVNSGFVSETARPPSIDSVTPLDVELGAGVAVLLPDLPSDYRVPFPPVTPKLAGGEVVRRSKSSPLWYISRPGESLSAIALFLAGACVTPGSLDKAPKGKKKLPSPRLGSRFEVDDRARQHLVDALFREQLKWLAYDDAKTLLFAALRERTPLLLPDTEPWPRPPDHQTVTPSPAPAATVADWTDSAGTEEKPPQQAEEEEITVLGVAPPVLDAEDAEALMRGEIVVEKDTKRRWAAFAGGEALTLRHAALSAASGAGASLTRGVVALPTAGATSLQLQSGGASSSSATGLPRTLRSAAKALQVEEAELRRLNAALGFVTPVASSTTSQQQQQPDKPANDQECKVSMLLLPEPLRSACASCHVSRISAWRCRSELKHTSQPCDKPPQGGWFPGARVRVLAKTRRTAVELDSNGVTEREREDVGRIWLEARVERALDNNDSPMHQGSAPLANVPAKSSSPSEPHRKLIVVESQAFDPLDGEIQGSHFIGKSRFVVHWPSAHVLACPAGTQFSQQQTRGAASALDKMRKFLVGRTLDSWGDGPLLSDVTCVALPRWRVVAVYRTIDEQLRLSGDDDLVAMLEPAARSLARSVSKLYGQQEQLHRSEKRDQEDGSAADNGDIRDEASMKRGHARYSATRLVATGEGWRACAACVVDGSCDVRRCRHTLRHEDPDSDAVPARGDTVRLRVPRGASFEWLYSVAIAARRPALGKDWTPSLPEDVIVVTNLYDDAMDSATAKPVLLEIAVRVSEVEARDKILAATGMPFTSKNGESVVVVFSWPKPRHAVSLPRSKQLAPGSDRERRLPTPEQRAWVGRFWRKKSEDFTKLRSAISRNDSSKGEARLRLVIDCFESFAEGMDGLCVEHVPASRRSASVAVCKSDAVVTRCDTWTETMVAADALGAALPWQPMQIDESEDKYNWQVVVNAAQQRKPGDTVQLDDAHHYFVCRGGETTAFVAEWTGADVTQLRCANAKFVAAAAVTSKRQSCAETVDDEEEDKANDDTRRQSMPLSSTPASDEGCGSNKRRRRGSSLFQSAGKVPKRQRRVARRLMPVQTSTALDGDEVFAEGDVVRIPAVPLLYARCIPSVDIVEGDLALAAGESSEEIDDLGVWYSCVEDDTCELISKTLSICDANEIVAANRHRRPLRALTTKSQLARWTILFVPKTRKGIHSGREDDGTEQPAMRNQPFASLSRRKPCAACIIAGVRSIRKCRDLNGHKSAPDYDDLSAAAPNPHDDLFVGARVRVRWVDEQSNTAQWLYATVMGAGARPDSYSIAYDDCDGVDEVQWPTSDAVALPRSTPTRPKVTRKDEALIGKTFEWADDHLERDGTPSSTVSGGKKQRWIVTDVFDSLDEGVDALVAMLRPYHHGNSSSKKPRREDEDDEIYETLEDLVKEATNWQDTRERRDSIVSEKQSSNSKRRRDEEGSNDDVTEFAVSADVLDAQVDNQDKHPVKKRS